MTYYKIRYTFQILSSYELKFNFIGFGNETRCFNELGCFSMENPWISNLRPFPQPMKPEEVDAKLYFYTRYN